MMKTIRIDHKTLILVNANVPDDVARKRYLDNIARSAAYVRNLGGNYSKKNSVKEEITEEIPEPDDFTQDDDE